MRLLHTMTTRSPLPEALRARRAAGVGGRLHRQTFHAERLGLRRGGH